MSPEAFSGGETLVEDVEPRQNAPEGRSSSHDRVVAAVVVGVATFFNLWCLRTERDPIHDLNDGAFHAAYVRWAADRISSGRSPFDGLFTTLGLGFPVFHHYQVLPHILTGVVGTVIDANSVYRWSLYLLLGLWPVGLYFAARLFGLARNASAAAAAVAPFLMSVPGYGFEAGSYLWRGYGMWSLLWGMWLFPFALALAWRAIDQRRSLVLAALVTAALVTSHALTGYLALVIIVGFAFVAGGRIVTRVVRTGLVLVGALAASAWLLIPTFRDQVWTRNSLPPGTFWTDSYGARQVLDWLVHGQLFDAGRWPVVTVLAAVGLVVTIWRARHDRLSRALLVITGVSFLMFFGRPTLGPLIDLLPAHDELFLHRMIVGVHLGGILIAGIGAVTVARAVLAGARRVASVPVPATVVSAVAVVGLVVVLAPAWTQYRGYTDVNATWMAQQRAAEASDGADFASLVDMAKQGGGRIYAGLRTNWGANYKIGFVPAVIELTDLDAQGIGFTGRVPALTEPSEGAFDDANPADYQLFDVQWAILPPDRPAPPGGMLVATAGRHRLFHVPTSGILQVADTTAPIVTSRDGIDVAVRPFVHSDLAAQGKYPLLALDGRAPGTPTVDPGAAQPAGPAGTVVSSSPSAADEVEGVVTANRPAAVVLKVSAHPRWRATVDGRSVPVHVVAPGFMAVDVPAGTHTVAFRYDAVSGWETLGWFVLGAVVLAGLWLYDRRSRRRPAADTEDQTPSASQRSSTAESPNTSVPSEPASSRRQSTSSTEDAGPRSATSPLA